MQKLKKFLNARSGATAIEYALIAGGISLAIAATMFTLGGQLSAAFSTI